MSLQTKQLVFDDFSSGIVTETRNVGGLLLSKPGVAQETNTYRCVALPTGGLGPLPASVSSLTIPTPVSPVRNNLIAVVGLDNIPMVGSSNTGPELHVGLEWAANNAPFNASFAWYAIRSSDSNSVQLKLLNTTIASSTLRTTPFFTTKTRLRSVTAQANHSIAASWEDGTGTNRRLWHWPDPASPSSTTPVESTTRSGAVLSHEGAVYCLPWSSVTHGSGVNLSNDQLCYSTPPLTTQMGTQNLLLSPTNPSGYGAWGSVGQQLILVKTFGGMVIVSGDFDTPNPQVDVLPTAASTGQVFQNITPTPMGMIYTDENCVWLWDGQVTQNISAQMRDGFFLRPDEAVITLAPKLFSQKIVKHCYWGGYVVFQDGWVWDTNTKSYWRLTQSNHYQLFTPHGTSLWACTGSFAPSATNQLNNVSLQSSATSYSWQSHPISASGMHYVDVREVEIVAQGAAVGSTVVITLTSSTGTTQSETFTLSAIDQPLRLRKPTYNFKGYNVIMRIEANSNSSSPAPNVLSVSLGIRDSHTTAGA